MNPTRPKTGIKVLIVTYPKGGPRVWADSLASKLRKNGYSAEVVTGRKNYFWAMFRRVSILHSCVPLPLSLARKYILTIKGDYQRENIRGRLLFPLARRMADAVTVPSEFLQQALGLENAEVISNGVELPYATKEDYCLLDENPTLGLITNFDFRQKADGAVTLAGIIRSAAPQAKLIIGGDGKYFQEYKDHVLRILPGTEFLGRCRKEDLFSRLDLFTYYSWLDNQPNIILEAMAYGLPIISNNVGAVQEILTGELSLCLASSEDKYATILRRLLASEETRRNCGVAARRRAGDFAWDKIIDEYKHLYTN